MALPLDRRLDRINARLDEGHAAKLAFLQRETGLPVSDIVKRGIDLLYEEVRKGKRHPFEVLSEVGFIGSGEGPADLSERYKEELRELLSDKHGDR